MPRENRLSYARDDDPYIVKALVEGIERLTGRDEIEARYEKALEVERAGVPFYQAALQELAIQAEIKQKENLSLIPKEGPVLIIANHPYGIVDGLIASEVAGRLRRNFKVLVNEVLCTNEIYDPYFLPIDFRETREATRRNVLSRQTAQDALTRGEAVILFPGGGVATRRLGFGKLEELPWGTFLAKLVTQTKTPVLPLYFSGGNSFLFHLVSQMNLNLRLALFIRETRKLYDSAVEVTVRKPVFYDELLEFSSKSALVSYLFQRTMESS